MHMSTNLTQAIDENGSEKRIKLATALPEMLGDDMIETLNGLRRLSREVSEVLRIANRELNESMTWHIGPNWLDTETGHRRPTQSRSIITYRRRQVSGSIKRTGGRSLR